mmetsp:Transcript_18106/g.22164  ORF Transcript_18106/g.22164 Transcript_18106/m.22164 type:complete len:818 (+) Transcript_18106:56-2509(+)
MQCQANRMGYDTDRATPPIYTTKMIASSIIETKTRIKILTCRIAIITSASLILSVCIILCLPVNSLRVPQQQHQRLPSLSSLHDGIDDISRKNRNGICSSSTQLFSSTLERVTSSSNLSSDPKNKRALETKIKNRLNQWHPKTQRELENSIQKLGRIGKTDDALSWYRYAWKGSSNTHTSHNNQNSSKALVKNNGIRPTTKLMNMAIDACARARPPRLEEAFRIFHDGVDEGVLSANVYTFGALMSACARSLAQHNNHNDDAFDRAITLLDTMQKAPYHVKPNAVVISTAILACTNCSPPRVDTALELLRKCQDDHSIEMNVVPYNTVLNALARSKSYATALNIFKEMRDGSRRNIPKPDQITYATMMNAAERSKRWRDVLRYATVMEQHTSFKLDGVAFTSILNACQHLGLAAEALFYLERMKLLRNNNSEEFQSKRLTRGRQRNGAKQALNGPDAVAYGLAISACSKGGRWMDGLALLKELKTTSSLGNSQNLVMAYTAAINGCQEVGEWRVALKILDQMKEDQVIPNVVTYSAAISSCATASANAESQDHGGNEKFEPMHAAISLLRRMELDGVRPNIVTYNSAIKACAEGLNVEGAFSLVQELEYAGLTPTLVTFGSLMTACERVGNVSGAGKVFTTMKEFQLEPNEIIYGAAISCCKKARQSDKAFALLQKMLKDGLSPNAATFNTVLYGLVEEDYIDKALTAYTLMETLLAPIQPSWKTLSILVRAFADDGRPEDAEIFLNKMRVFQYVPDVDLYTVTVTAYERQKQPRKALRLMEQMRDDGYDYYDIPILNTIMTNAVKIVNEVGRNLPD